MNHVPVAEMKTKGSIEELKRDGLQSSHSGGGA
jgi:hypothetical protein